MVLDQKDGSLCEALLVAGIPRFGTLFGTIMPPAPASAPPAVLGDHEFEEAC